MVEEYSGPVFYILHAPTSMRLRTYDRNRKRLALALRKAASRGIPVVFDHFDSNTPVIEAELAKLKKKPRVIMISATDNDRQRKLVTAFRIEGINPTKIVGMGLHADSCLPNNLLLLRKAFPSAEVYLIKSHSEMVFERNSELRIAFRKSMRQHGITQSRKLNPRHMI